MNIAVDMNMQMSELMMMSSPHNFPYTLFTEMTKMPYFSYEKVKLALKTTLNKCRTMFALKYLDIRTLCLSKENENFQNFIYKIHEIL